MKPILEVRNLWKQYKIGGKKASYLSLREQLLQGFERSKQETFWALQDINFDVYKGECIGIIGRNGTGKSTLLKILSQITPPTKGYIKARGRVASLLEVGTGFHPELTGRENVYLNGSILGLRQSEIKAKFDEIVDFSGVEQFLDTPLKHYSSGMRLRLAFSVAAHLEPEILLIDEVLAVGDAEFQKKCLGKMDEVSKSGRTVLFVSHNLGAVQQLCEKSLLLNHGKVIKIASTPDIINYYNKSFLSSPQIFDSNNKIGKQDFIIKKITIFDIKSRKDIASCFSGQEIQFKVEIENLKNQGIKELIIGLSIKNYLGQFLTALNNKMSGNTFEQELDYHQSQKNIVVICSFKVPFMKGTYFLDLNLHVAKILQHKMEDAFTLKVEEGDYYNSSFPNAWGRQGLYIQQRWSIKK